MKNKKPKFLIILWLVTALTGIQAQESINASGGIAKGSGGSSSYSVGQCVYQTITGSNGSVAAGVQHPYEIMTVTAIEVAKHIQLLVAAFPNPVTNLLKLEVGNFDFSNLSFLLYDAKGNQLQSAKIIGQITYIDMSRFSAGMFYINVIREKREIKTFKIIKK